MLVSKDCSFIRITPAENRKATIKCYYEYPNELIEELQRIAFAIYYSINAWPINVFPMYSKGMKDIEVHSVFDKNHKFQYDIVVHGFESTYDLVDYLCDVSNGIIGGKKTINETRTIN